MAEIFLCEDLGFKDTFMNLNCSGQSGESIAVITSGEPECTVLTKLFSSLLSPSSGTIHILQQDIRLLTNAAKARLREKIGIVSGSGNLISNLKLWENITLPKLYHSGEITTEDTDFILRYLTLLGFSGNTMTLPAHLSHFERVSATFIRAALMRPPLMMFSYLFETLTPSEQDCLSVAIHHFRSELPDSTYIILTGSDSSHNRIPVDRTHMVHE